METLDLGLDVIAGAARISAALVFVIGARHKLKAGAAFEGTVAAYRLLPQGWASPAARTLPWLELTAALMLIWPSAAVTAVGPALALLLPMTMAVSINLLRGRTWIDCGCGGTDGEGLSWALVLRNAVLMLLLVVAARPLSLADLGAGGMLLLLALGLMLASLFYSSSQLAANARRWQLIAGGGRT